MKQFYYQLKTREEFCNGSVFWGKATMKGIVEAETCKEARQIVKTQILCREINSKETFNRGTAKKGVCKNCGKEFILYQGTNGYYCCAKCQMEHQYKEWLENWKNGKEDGLSGGFALSKRVRRYLFEKYDCKCQLCGWGEVNEHTGLVPLQVHHIDGNCLNNSEDNLQLLCPNCHSLTENFGSRNKNGNNGRTKYFKKG